MRLSAASLWKNYGFATCVTIAIFFLRLYLNITVQYQAPFMIFVAAVIMAGWYGGLLSGLTATILSAFLGSYYFLPSRYEFGFTDPNDVVKLVVFISIGVLISLFCAQLHDINRRLVRQNDLAKKNDDRIALALRASNDGVWDWDLKTNIIYLSEALREQLGFSVDAVVDRDGLLALIHPDDKERMGQNALAYVMQPQGAYHDTGRFRGVDGTWRWILTRGLALKDSDGVPYRMVGTHTDVTDQRAQDEQTLQSERLFRSVFNQQFQFMAILDAQGSMREINDLLLQTLQARREDLIGKVFWELPFWSDIPDIAAKWNYRLEEAAKSDEAVIGEDIFHGAGDDAVRIAAIAVKAIKDNKGVVEFYIIQASDITDRKVVQEALRESERRWRLAIQGMNDGIWDFNPITSEVYFTPRYKEMLGYQEHELENHPDLWRQLIHPDDHDAALQEITRYFNREIPEYKHMFRLRHRDNSWRWILARGKALWNEDGKVIRFTGSHADMTDLQRAVEKAEAANEAKSDFLANMSHEIRTPMGAVIGLANLLQNQTLTPEKQREFIHALQLSAQSLMDLINDLLDIAKIENDQMQLETVPFSLKTILDEVAGIMLVKAKERKINLVVHNNIRATQFLGDPLRLRQVIMNLVSNALKFTEKGQVTIHTEIGHLADDSGLTDIVIEIADTGVGIAQDKLDMIFHKFSQEDASIARKHGGTGLGLSISKQLVELMGGTISASSAIGEGSVFKIALRLPSVYIPEKGLTETVLSPAAIPSPMAKKAEILLVEDYKGNVLVATSMLDNFGYAWDHVENGALAVEKIKNTTYKMVLMDVQMPEMDGMQATRLIRAHETENKLPHMPIVAMTAYSLSGDRERCLESGMDDYISKPFKPEVLLEKIKFYLAKHDNKAI